MTSEILGVILITLATCMVLGTYYITRKNREACIFLTILAIIFAIQVGIMGMNRLVIGH